MVCTVGTVQYKRQTCQMDRTPSHSQEVWVYLRSTHHFQRSTASLPLLHTHVANAVYAGDAARKCGCVCAPPATSGRF